MFLYLPKEFDSNEWFTLVAIIINILTFKLLPKRLPKELTPLIVLLSIAFPKVLDHTMAVKPYDLYNISDSKNYELFDVILYGAYPMFGYLFIYLYDVFQPKKTLLVLYFLGWSIFAGGFEFLLNKLQVFSYTGWHLTFSFPVYLTTLCLTFLFYKFTKNYLDKNGQMEPAQRKGEPPH
nr:hypothetical protein [Neobacillus sp. Marseille-Q6967]